MPLKAVKDHHGVRVFIGAKEIILDEKTSQGDLEEISKKKAFQHLVEQDGPKQVKGLPTP